MRQLTKAFIACGLLMLIVNAAQQTIAQDTLHIGNTAEPGTMDPHRYFSNAEEHILKDLFLGLTTMGPAGEILPGTAEHWSQSEDGLQWRFYLNPAATWSDGKPLTAQDFVFSLRRYQDPKTASPLAHFLYCIENAEAVNRGEMPPSELGVTAEDDHTLVVNLTQPFPFLLERLLYPIAYPIPKHAVEAHGDAWIKAENWVSNGAYVLAEWRPSEFVALKKNPHFLFSDDVAIESARYYPLTEPATAYNRFIAGDMDVIHDYPHNLVERVLAERPDEVRNVPLQSIMYLVFNMEAAPFDDVRVRQALEAAIFKDRITQQILGAGELSSSTLAPSLVDEFPVQSALGEPSVERAKALLMDAGYTLDKPLEITLRYFSSEVNKSVYVAIAAMWKEAGVNVTLHHTNLPTHFSDLQNGDFQVAQAGWFGENNPEHYIELLWSKIGPANYGRYASSTFDRLFEQARQVANVEARIQLLREAELIALKEVPVIPLYVTMTLNLVKPHVGGWSPNGRNLHPVRFMYWQDEP